MFTVGIIINIHNMEIDGRRWSRVSHCMEPSTWMGIKCQTDMTSLTTAKWFLHSHLKLYETLKKM